MESNYIPLKEGESIFDMKFPLEDIMASRKHMIESGQLIQLETPYGTLEYIKHPLLENSHDLAKGK